jgi:hypothetical protein
MPACPTNLRETFELFRFYRPDVGIRRLIQDAGIGGMSPRQIYQAVHARSPDTLEAAVPSSNYDGTASFIAALSSIEFQQNLAAHFLRAFPEKRRLFFVHIPKTAGVDVATRLISRFPSINTNLLNRLLTPSSADLFLAIKHIILEMECSDTVFISGHTHLTTYQNWTGNGIRLMDDVFTVVREPIARILSQVNYVITRIFAEQSPPQPDTLGWRKEFKVTDLSIRESPEKIFELARRILRNQGVVVPNIMCEYIGGSNYESALTKTAAHDMEVIDLKQLDAWTEERWGVSDKTRLNTSEKFLSMTDFLAEDIAYARSIVQEDIKYYARVLAGLDRYGSTSIRGAQIIR